MNKQIPIAGGGTTGWLTAGCLARPPGARSPGSIEITVVGSAEIGILGVGGGAFPTIRKTLRRIGVDEATLVREASATFKQGVRDMIGKMAQAMTISRKVSGRFAAARSTADVGLGWSDSTTGAAG